MTYREAIKYLGSFINYEKITAYPYRRSLKLKRVRDFLSVVGNPQRRLKCIHIAGSKGKGSVCAFIAYILREAGYQVGLYTSPHLSDFRERIRILTSGRRPHAAGSEFEGMISRNELSGLVKRLRPAIEKYNRNSQCGRLSFFEACTALAFIYFREKKVDFAVLETGLGGRLDATNTAKPLVCAITPISYEHTDKLGKTLREIAKEKAGIVKAQKAPGLIVISAAQEEEARRVIINRCKQVKAKLFQVGKEIKYKRAGSGFVVKGVFGEYGGLTSKLLGGHQMINAATAIGAVEALRFYGIEINVDAIWRGVYNTVWPGRCEVIARNPLVILDGAQNIASAQALKKVIKDNFSATKLDRSAFSGKYKKLILLLGISQDKDLKGICSELRGLADEIVLTRANNPRAAKPEMLASYFKGKSIYITQNTKEAKELALGLTGKGGLLLVTGSLFVAGEFRQLFSKSGKKGEDNE